jgi:CBS domain-containing protein
MGLLRLAEAQKTLEVSREVSVMEAVRLMSRAQVGAIAVTADHRIVGVFTERDLMRRVVCEGRDPSSVCIEEVMTSPVETVSDETSVGEAAGIMRSRHIRHLAVVDEDGAFLGLVAQRYLLDDLLSALEVKVDSLEGYIMADGIGG